MVDVTNSSSSSSSASGIAPDDDSYDDTDADAAAGSSPAASGGVRTGGSASNLGDATDSNAGGVLDGAEDEEWPLSAGDQQEAGRLSLPVSVPIFEGITYQSADGQPWRPARQPAAKKQQVCLNAARLRRAQ